MSSAADLSDADWVILDLPFRTVHKPSQGEQPGEIDGLTLAESRATAKQPFQAWNLARSRGIQLAIISGKLESEPVPFAAPVVPGFTAGQLTNNRSVGHRLAHRRNA